MYSTQTLAATTYNEMPISWSVTEGNWTDGLTLDNNTGVISGTPTKAGKFTFPVKAESTGGSDTKQLTIQTVSYTHLWHAAYF